MKEIHLTQGKVALVDDADFDLVMATAKRWHAARDDRRVYARCYGPRDTRIHLHRLILNAPDGLLVDHIDSNGLNNQRSNLRLCTSSQNTRNARCRTDRIFKGVHPYKSTFFAQVVRDGRIYQSRGHATRESAARAYDALAHKHHGEFAHLNFPIVEA